jgi:nucleotide-binding universal stress UspA family protein
MSGRPGPTIVFPTDFSAAGDLAFAHALKLALALRSRLLLLHVDPPRDDDQAERTRWDDFPSVRATLARWGLVAADAARSSVLQIGLDVAKYELRDWDIADAIEDFAREHEAGLLVLATRGTDGLERRLRGSVSRHVADRLRLPSLFVPAGARGFVDLATGALTLGRALAPVDHQPDARSLLPRLAGLLASLGASDALDLVHSGTAPPVFHVGPERRALPVRSLRGPVVESILAAAQEADLIVMPTAGRHGMLDALRGSTTERVIAHAPCPVLAFPVD